MKPTIRKIRDIRGRKITGYSATLGPIEAYGSTPSEAQTSAWGSVARTLERLDRGAFIGHWNGRAYVVIPDVAGWAYWIDTSSSAHITSSNYLERESAINAALYHLAQNLWTAETADTAYLLSLPESLRPELASWIGFQRAYLRERAAGTPENLIHQIACERPERIDVPTVNT